ncbi:uncharacterized [Tachysurus ichikawai]
MMDISFRMENKGRIHIINVSFEGGDIGHKWLACPHSKQREVAAYDTIEENRCSCGRVARGRNFRSGHLRAGLEERSIHALCKGVACTVLMKVPASSYGRGAVDEGCFQQRREDAEGTTVVLNLLSATGEK